MQKHSKIRVGLHILAGRLLIAMLLIATVGEHALANNVVINSSGAITITTSKQSLASIMNIIEEQSSYRFFYNQSINLNVVKAVNITNKTIEETLDELFEGTGIAYELLEEQIILKEETNNRLQQAQLRSISGKVTDASGTAIPGATIIVKGTTNGTITDLDGNFLLSGIELGKTLMFSFVGMQTQEVQVVNDAKINISLKPNAIGLDEVVAIGYGTVKKRDLTGAVSSVSSAEVLSAPTPNAMEAIQGRVAGLDIVKPSGQIGGNVEILLRGSRSIYGDNSPLFIIDGIQGTYDQVNPTDIESIDVLKDASSTAIYGSSGANGVVIITTKRGKEGKATVNFDAYYGVSGKVDFANGMTGDEWTNYQREAYKYLNGQYPADMSAIITDPTIQQHYNNENWIDWIDEASGNTATDQRYNISVTGGTKKTQLFTSFSYANQDGLLANENLQRYSFRSNIDQEISESVKLGVTSNITYTDMSQGNEDTFQKGISALPLGEPYDEEGNVKFEYSPNFFSPMGDFIKNQYIDMTRTTYVNTSAYIDIKLIKDLSYRSIINTTLENARQGEYWGEQATALRPSYAGSPYAQIINRYNWGYIWENILTYSKTVNNHTFGGTFVTSWAKNINERNIAGGTGQQVDSWTFNRLNSASSSYVYSANTQTQRMSYAIRANYSYLGKYIFSFSNRWDGVSWLAEDHKWDFFPAASAAWRISDESFMDDTKSWLDNLKLRAGYGVTGNSGGVGAYETMSTPIAYSGAGVSVDGEIASFTQYTGMYGNRALGWEKSYNLNIGLDLGFFNNRISANIDWYKTNTHDLLFKRTMPITSGVTGWGRPLQMWENIAETSSRGIELTLNTHNVKTKDFNWYSTITFTRSKEKIESLPSGDLESENLFEGHAVRSFYGYKYAGIWGTDATEDELNTYGVKPGWVKIETSENFDENGNGDGGVHAYSESDRKILGHSNPNVVFGLNNNFTYKAFDLGIFVMGRFGHMIESDLVGRYSAQTGLNKNQISGVDYWTETNQGAYFPVPGSGDESTTFLPALRYRDGSFIKLKNLTLGYTLPENLANRALMQKCRVYATAYNPALWVKDKQLLGSDPENNGNDKFPLYRQFVFGVNITF